MAKGSLPVAEPAAGRTGGPAHQLPRIPAGNVLPNPVGRGKAGILGDIFPGSPWRPQMW